MENLFAGIAQSHRKELEFFQAYITLGFQDKSVVNPGIAIFQITIYSDNGFIS